MFQICYNEPVRVTIEPIWFDIFDMFLSLTKYTSITAFFLLLKLYLQSNKIF